MHINMEGRTIEDTNLTLTVGQLQKKSDGSSRTGNYKSFTAAKRGLNVTLNHQKTTHFSLLD